jgi:hypothetical protein
MCSVPPTFRNVRLTCCAKPDIFKIRSRLSHCHLGQKISLLERSHTSIVITGHEWMPNLCTIALTPVYPNSHHIQKNDSNPNYPGGKQTQAAQTPLIKRLSTRKLCLASKDQRSSLYLASVIAFRSALYATRKRRVAFPSAIARSNVASLHFSFV